MQAINPSLKTIFQQDRESQFRQLYLKVFPAVARMIRQSVGKLSDANDVFQDALIILFEKAMQEKLEIRVSPEAYLLGIAKHLWIRQKRQKPINLPLTEAEQQMKIPADFYSPPPTRPGLIRYLSMAGQKCLELLRAFYYQQKSLSEIATEFNYSGVRSATVQKYKCLEKIRTIVKQKSVHHEEIPA